MARCIGCHLERQLSPLPVPGTNSLGVQVCPKCSKDIDRTIGILGIFSIDLVLPAESLEPSEATETDEKKPRKAQ